jgi:hypothetical protein
MYHWIVETMVMALSETCWNKKGGCLSVDSQTEIEFVYKKLNGITPKSIEFTLLLLLARYYVFCNPGSVVQVEHNLFIKYHVTILFKIYFLYKNLIQIDIDKF